MAEARMEQETRWERKWSRYGIIVSILTMATKSLNRIHQKVLICHLCNKPGVRVKVLPLCMS